MTTIEKSKHRTDRPLSALDSWLEGEEAAKLYVAEIGCKIGALDQQIGLLKTALAERKQLLREIAPNPAPRRR